MSTPSSPGMRTIVIGDVHGCLNELIGLLQKVKYVEGVDRVILVGDLVGKGPLGPQTVRYAREHQFESTIGNHDECILQWRKDILDKKENPRELEPTHRHAVDNLNEADWIWLENLPYYIQLPQYNVIIVHAGLVPNVPLENQNKFDMTHMRNLTDKMVPSELIVEGEPWAQVWKGPQTIIFGHDASRKLQKYPFALGLDTGCCYGGELTCCLLPTREIISVEAHAQYCAKQPNRLIGK